MSFEDFEGWDVPNIKNTEIFIGWRNTENNKFRKYLKTEHKSEHTLVPVSINVIVPLWSRSLNDTVRIHDGTSQSREGGRRYLHLDHHRTATYVRSVRMSYEVMIYCYAMENCGNLLYPINRMCQLIRNTLHDYCTELIMEI